MEAYHLQYFVTSLLKEKMKIGRLIKIPSIRRKKKKKKKKTGLKGEI